eukprot:Skav205909  [mRNA]  locus=scaffold123:446850:448027:+ [translate_table: standard]
MPTLQLAAADAAVSAGEARAMQRMAPLKGALKPTDPTKLENRIPKKAQRMASLRLYCCREKSCPPLQHP